MKYDVETLQFSLIQSEILFFIANYLIPAFTTCVANSSMIQFEILELTAGYGLLLVNQTTFPQQAETWVESNLPIVAAGVYTIFNDITVGNNFTQAGMDIGSLAQTVIKGAQTVTVA